MRHLGHRDMQFEFNRPNLKYQHKSGLAEPVKAACIGRGIEAPLTIVNAQ
jgi:hypothetical protein